MVFRTNFTFIWIIANGIYFILVLWLVEGDGSRKVVNDGSFGYLEVFSLYLASLVVFRVFFSGLYILNWKLKYLLCSPYRVKYYDLQAEFKKIKSKTNVHGDSTDDEEMDEKVHTIFKANEKAVRKKIRKLEDVEGTKQDIHDATLNFIQKNGAKGTESDSENGDFSDADIEEAEDRVYKEYKKRKLAGKDK